MDNYGKFLIGLNIVMGIILIGFNWISTGSLILSIVMYILFVVFMSLFIFAMNKIEDWFKG